MYLLYVIIYFLFMFFFCIYRNLFSFLKIRNSHFQESIFLEHLKAKKLMLHLMNSREQTNELNETFALKFLLLKEILSVSK
jgi:hypothetical protein